LLSYKKDSCISGIKEAEAFNINTQPIYKWSIIK